MLALIEAGIPCEIIPGVSSSIAVPEIMGIPVTHRKTARSFTVVTGHTAQKAQTGRTSSDEEIGTEGRASDGESGPEGEDVDFASLARLDGTLIFLMGLHAAGRISSALIAAGKAADTTCAILSNGFRPGERRVNGPLSDLAAMADCVRDPAVIVIGPVAAMDLVSTVKRPLDGRHILVTGTDELTKKMEGMLKAAGASVSRCVSLRTCPGEGGLDRAFSLLFGQKAASGPASFADISAAETAGGRPGAGQWLVFTSANGVRIFFAELKKRRIDVRRLSGLYFAAIGPGTADALSVCGILADFVPSSFDGKTFGRELPAEIRSHSREEASAGEPPVETGSEGPRALLLRADIASKDLPDELEQAGISFEDIPIYRTEALPVQQTYEADTVVFFSASGVRSFTATAAIPAGAAVVCIGPACLEAYRKLPDAGDHPCSLPSEYTCEGILQLLCAEGSQE